MKRKRLLATLITLMMLCIVFCACSGSKVKAVKDDIYDQYYKQLEVALYNGALEISSYQSTQVDPDAVLKTLKIDYEKEDIQGDRVALVGEATIYMSHIDKTFHFPFEARGNLNNGTGRITNSEDVWVE